MLNFKRNNLFLKILRLILLWLLLFTMFNDIKYIFYKLNIKKQQSINNKNEYKLIFEKIIEKWCDPRNLSLNYVCLNRINELDRKFNDNFKKICSNDEKILFHTFWQFGNESSFHFRVLKLNIMSFLTTQNLNCSKLILWTLNNFPLSIKADIFKTFELYVKSQLLEFKIFDLKELCYQARHKNTHFGKSSICIFSHKLSYFKIYNIVWLSDLVRFFVLDIYGGINFSFLNFLNNFYK